MKLCSRCQCIKPTVDFSKDKHHQSGYKSACKACAKNDWIKWKTTNIEGCRKSDRKRHYIRMYGLDPLLASQLVENRVGVCSICGNISPLVVDHCHTTKKVRGFICQPCNSVLGYSRDNKQTLLAAVAYLEKSYE